ncbi:hypothetical protein [Massilia sp. TSP1-1-2]|uniref:hypothetical protein n=1 Tax=Massilia sp. TSP1-1-2 TaxID=2804649 RepID=UPI003CEC69FF
MTITKKDIPRYVIRTADGDYGVVALEVGERSVTVLAESSFGSYCYHWNATGCNPIRFLGNMSRDYAMGKFRGHDYMVFDREKQEQEHRKAVIAKRRERQMEHEDARWCYDEIGHVCDARSLDQYWANFYHNDDLIKHLYGGDIGDQSAETRPDSQCVGFWESIWVPLMEHLAAETATAPAIAEAI